MSFFVPEIAALIPPTPVPLGDSFDALYGLKVTELTPERVAAYVPIRDAVKQPAGLVHGGVLASVAETLASWGTTAGVVEGGRWGVGLSNQVSFLRPASEGRLCATAVRRHAGQRTWVWDVELADEDGRPYALARVTVAAVAAKAPSGSSDSTHGQAAET